MLFPWMMLRPILVTLLLTLTLLTGCSKGPVQVPPAGKLKEQKSGIHRLTAKVPGVGDVKYALEVPNNYDGQSRVPLVMILHYGYQGARPDPYTGADMMDAFRSGLGDLGAILVAPDALGGDWTSTDNEKAVAWLTQSIIKTYKIDTKKVILTGYSLGGEGTWFIGSRHQKLFTAAIPVAAPVAGADVKWQIPVYVIHSNRDQVVSHSTAKSHAEKLQRKGAKVQFQTVQGLDHYATGQYGGYLQDGVSWVQSQWK